MLDGAPERGGVRAVVAAEVLFAPRGSWRAVGAHVTTGTTRIRDHESRAWDMNRESYLAACWRVE